MNRSSSFVGSNNNNSTSGQFVSNTSFGRFSSTSSNNGGGGGVAEGSVSPPEGGGGRPRAHSTSLHNQSMFSQSAMINNQSFFNMGGVGGGAGGFGNYLPSAHAEIVRETRPDELHSDCDSEGNDPPKGDHVAFIDPLSIEETGAPTQYRGAADAVKLPFYEPKERVRFRENYESRVSYEAWTENDAGGGAAGGRAAHRRDVRKLEDDSDFPVGRRFFWKAFCRKCNKGFDEHVPPMWQCMTCKSKVWQHPEDPESANCGVCTKRVEKIRMVGARKVRNPMLTNAHMCKRCGRVVCDKCYTPVPVKLEEWGYTEEQRICKDCVDDLEAIKKIPEEEDFGTLHDEDATGAIEDTTSMQPYWAPRCGQCNVTFAKPPPRWQCPTCSSMVWQPYEAADSAACWICASKYPKTRCHKCGQLVCQTCGSFGQPLPEMGFDDGRALSVCRCCYSGVANKGATANGEGGSSEEITVDIAKQGQPQPWRGSCPGCGNTTATPPDQWSSRCHKRKTWQPEDNPKSSKCAVCDCPLAEGAREHCCLCGMLVCLSCAQYKQPLPERGYPKGVPQTICKLCFDPKLAYVPDHTDSDYWPPKCPQCHTSWAAPPSRWRCTNQCGNVWQPQEHIASKACSACGKKILHGSVNCRRCGRIVCAGCGSGRAEVLERGFARGLDCPVCPPCLKIIKPPPPPQEQQQQGQPGGGTPAITHTPTPGTGTPSLRRPSLTPGSAGVPSSAASSSTRR